MRSSAPMPSRAGGARLVLRRPLVGGMLSLIGFVGLGAALVTSTRRVAGPPGWAPSALRAWFDRQPVSAAFSILAAIGLVVVLYLILSTVAIMVAAVAQAARLPRLGRVAEVFAVPVVRRTLAALLGFGITVANPGPAHAANPTTTIALMSPLEEPSSGSPVATMHSLDIAPPPAPTPDASWTIRAGDTLWGLAAAALAETWSTAPTDAEVSDYLTLVVEQNRDTLAVPDDPDLVFPGQVFIRPPVRVR